MDLTILHLELLVQVVMDKHSQDSPEHFLDLRHYHLLGKLL